MVLYIYYSISAAFLFGLSPSTIKRFNVFNPSTLLRASAFNDYPKVHYAGVPPEDYTNFKNSSVVRRACFKRWLNVDLFIGECAGTVIFNVSLNVAFCILIWFLTNNYPSVSSQRMNNLFII